MKVFKTTVDGAKKVYNNMKAPTPRWAKILRNVGIVLTAIGTGIAAAPALFPAAVVSAGAYLIIGGSVSSAIFQSVKKTE